MLKTTSTTIYYFAFGSNMSSKTLLLRGIIPKNSGVPVRAIGYTLSFTNRGYEGSEPCFADICKSSIGSKSNNNAVHGVAYEISSQDIQILDKFEGAAYDRISINVEPYDQSSSFEVETYVTSPAHKTTSPNNFPSKRYVQLLLDGAKANNLSTEYCNNVLKKIQVFDCKGTIMPSVPSDAKQVELKDLKKYAYQPVVNLTTTNETLRSVWVSMGSQVYDVSKNVAEREMLQHMATAAGGTTFVLRLWRSAYGNKANHSTNQSNEDDAKEDDENIVNGLETNEKEYVSSWAQHLHANYPFVGVVNKRQLQKKRKSSIAEVAEVAEVAEDLEDQKDQKDQNDQKEDRQDKEGEGEKNKKTTSSRKRVRNEDEVDKKDKEEDKEDTIQGKTEKIGATGTTDTTDTTDLTGKGKRKKSKTNKSDSKESELKKINQECVTIRYHLTLGILRPCVLRILVKVFKFNQGWWVRDEKKNLEELSRGIHANSAEIFTGIGAADESAPLGPTVPLTTLSYNYNIHLTDDAESFDSKHASLSINNDTGEVNSEMLLPCIMTCNVAPLE